MRYIDVLNESGITQNILALDFKFKSYSDTVINLTGQHIKNLSGMTNLSEAMSFLDELTMSENGTVAGNLTVSDSNGNEYLEVEKIVFSDVSVTGENEVTIGEGSLDRTINDINNKIVIYEGISAETHTFIHNKDSEFLKIDVWVEESSGWQNSIVPITIIDNNTIKVELAPARPIRIIVENINDISKTYGL